MAFLKDFEFTGKAAGGGQASGDEFYWEPLDETHGGCRVVMTDRIVGGSDDEEIEEDHRTAALHLCRHCGAAHPTTGARCLNCSTVGKRVVLHAVRHKKNNPGYLSSCLSCGANGRRIGSRYREPARTVRATNVAPAPSAKEIGSMGWSMEPKGEDLVTVPGVEVGEYWPLVRP